MRAVPLRPMTSSVYSAVVIPRLSGTRWLPVIGVIASLNQKLFAKIKENTTNPNLAPTTISITTKSGRKFLDRLS